MSGMMRARVTLCTSRRRFASRGSGCRQRSCGRRWHLRGCGWSATCATWGSACGCKPYRARRQQAAGFGSEVVGQPHRHALCRARQPKCEIMNWLTIDTSISLHATPCQTRLRACPQKGLSVAKSASPDHTRPREALFRGKLYGEPVTTYAPGPWHLDRFDLSCSQDQRG
jgi:hypothetical protein